MPESPFCDTCQRNQLLVNRALANYIPDEDDPEYEKYAAAADEYRTELEERYPQVCENCFGRVQQQILEAGYAAKADHFRRVLEQSRQHRAESYTARQFWTLAIIRLAKWSYLWSVLVGLFWHASGVTLVPSNTPNLSSPSWKNCLNDALVAWRMDQACVLSPNMLRLVKTALIADLLTIWWNPKLEQKMNRAGGRMRGLRSLWTLRALILTVRYVSIHVLNGVGSGLQDLRFYHSTHGALLAILLLGTIFCWRCVHITYHTKSFAQRLDAHLPSAPNSVEKPTRSKARTTLPNNTSFDTMAQSFTSSFQASDFGGSSTGYPPSPSPSSSSTSTHDSDSTTPRLFGNESRARVNADSMDWTPTQKRFTNQQATVLPLQWPRSTSPTPEPPAPKEPHSIFGKPDPNPFHHRIPAAPKGPAASRVDPWKPGIWAPPLKETTRNFFKENKHAKGAGLQGVGVPKTIQREAELFEPPKFKYDNYGSMKETGLEGSFNDLFSK